MAPHKVFTFGFWFYNRRTVTKLAQNGAWTKWIWQVRIILSELSPFYHSLSPLLNYVLWSLGDSDCWLFVVRSKPSQLLRPRLELITQSISGRQSTKQQPSFQIWYISEPVWGLLCFAVPSYFSKARFFHVAIDKGQILQYGHTYQLNDCTNVKTMDVCTCRMVEKWKWLHLRTILQWNKTNFLLTATLFPMYRRSWNFRR